MRILVVSNFYPPYFIGGYELGCRDVVEELKSRGHEIKILTSTYGVKTDENDGEVYRELPLIPAEGAAGYEMKLAKAEVRSLHLFKRLVELIKPDIVYFWNLSRISFAPLFWAHQVKLPLCYYISDDWLAHWESHDKWTSWRTGIPPHTVKRLLKSVAVYGTQNVGIRKNDLPLDLTHAQFTSAFLKEQALKSGKPVSVSPVIHWGIDINRFRYRSVSSNHRSKLLYVGQLVAHKGVHTAIEALKKVVGQPGNEDTTLTIVGGTIAPQYEETIRKLIEDLDLERNVQLTGLVPRDQLPFIYQEHDILIFPSLWDEPFSITLLEALASGLAVVSTDTGGTPEILKHKVNSLLFPKGDAQACADAISSLLESEELKESLRACGRQTVEREFQMPHMVDKIEHSLLNAIEVSAT